ncbi:MAG: 3-deoxy-7-phosphoheptulonate synthase AroG [Ruminobacter sp.]|nr:3-deoxy-7-phosphoheptulonate synthase AroG [Ruminobacter sp.]
MTEKIYDTRISEITDLLPPVALIEKYPLSEKMANTVVKARDAIHNIMNGTDDRLLVIIGPCSIHDTKSALEYAEKLNVLREKYADTLEVVMRVYFEKPRTTVGWKGLINDPYMDNSYDMNAGLKIGRKLLADINEMGMPTATEYLDVLTPQYLDELISWVAIGARTTESQVHRELASGTSAPVGFKNGTDGTVKIAIDALQSAKSAHTFLSVTKFGHSAIVKTLGNEDCHIILRGGNKGPNYSVEHVSEAVEALSKAKLIPSVMVDFSHANSHKQFKKQVEVAENIAEQISSGSKGVFGVMIESHLVEGRQDLVEGCADKLVYGQSITDACIGWEDSELVLEKLSQAIVARRNK